jgi:hypothetical protein
MKIKSCRRLNAVQPTRSCRLLRAVDFLKVTVILLSISLITYPSLRADEPLVQDDTGFAKAETNKKGLQVEWTEDALSLGIRHAAINLDLTSLLRLDNSHAPSESIEISTGRFIKIHDDVFKKAGTASEEETFRFALPIVERNQWP